jgi:polysaccharide biosynthesis transport protein
LRNAADLNKKSVENPLKVIEYPIMPLKAESSKRAMLSSFAAIATGTLTLLFMFFMSYFESSPSSPQLLKRLTGLKTIGILNTLSNKSNNNLNQLFANYTDNKEAEYFKESIRRIRTEIEHSESKSFLFASPKEQEGKSLIVATLAHVFMMKNAKVLIIDTNFKNNTLTQLSNTASQSQSLNTQGIATFKSSDLGFQINLDKIDIIGNKGGHNSPSELLAGVDFKKKLEKLSLTYDYIFFEAAALNKYSDARELLDYVDKIIMVLDAKNKISRTDNEAITFAKNSGTKLLGAILNKVDLKNIL